MATVEQKIRCEHRARELIAQAGLPAPDHVEYGFTCVRLLWLAPRLMLRVDIDDEADPAPVVLVEEPRAGQPPLAPESELYDDYDPLARRDAESVN